MNNDLIVLENVCKGYQLAGERRLEVLHNISGTFPRHAWSILLGASGSGKTTLLNLIGALERPDSGRLLFDGTDYSTFMRSSRAAADFRNRRIGFIFQNYQLLPEFTIYENVLIPAKLAGADIFHLHSFFDIPGCDAIWRQIHPLSPERDFSGLIPSKK